MPEFVLDLDRWQQSAVRNLRQLQSGVVIVKTRIEEKFLESGKAVVLDYWRSNDAVEIAVKIDGDIFAIITHPCSGAKWFVHFSARLSREKEKHATRKGAIDRVLRAIADEQCNDCGAAIKQAEGV
jgi:hypothetical protein